MLEPLQQLILMAGAVAAEIPLANRRGQGREGHPSAIHRLLTGGHVAVAKLVGHDEVGFRPHRHHRLITASAFVVRQGRALVTFDEGRVLIDGGDLHPLALLRVTLGDAPHQARLDLLQGANRVGAGKDETLLFLAGGPQSAHLLVVEALEEGAEGGDLGKLEAEATLQTGIGLEEGNVLGTFAADGLEENERFDELCLGEAAIALLEGEVGSDEIGQLEGAKGTRGCQESGAGAGHLLEGARVEVERGLGLDWEARGHGQDSHSI